jgi:hypothetical protein
MIITKQKDFNQILKSIGNKSVFIMGCSECAELCKTGGEKEVLDMKRKLTEHGIKVSGWIVLDPACHSLNNKRLLRNYKNEIKNSEKFLLLTCGNGIQTVSNIYENMDIISGTNTLFLGEIKHANEFERGCNLCGSCIVDDFEGLCPISKCPKNMLNGPCGGSKDGKCEINNELNCIWNIIYYRLKNKNKLSKLKEIKKPINWSKTYDWKRTC